jgi:hypothetical protein
MADTQQPLPIEAPLPPTPNPPGTVHDLRDGIRVESNTGTTDELAKSLDALDAAIAEQADTAEATGQPVPREAKSGRFTSKERRTNPVARMEEATAREATAKRERDAATAENARLKAELDHARRPATAAAAPPAAPHATLPPPPAPTDPEPDPHDPARYPAGEYDPQYLRDVGRWEARQEYQKQRAADQQTQRREQHLQGVERGMGTYAERMRAAFPEPAKLTEYLQALPPQLIALRPSAVQALVQPGAPLTAGNTIADVIVESDQPVAIKTYFKDHPDVFQRLLTLHPIAVLREMGRIEERLATAAASQTRTAPSRDPVSRARPPVQRVESVPQMSDSPPGDDASDEEHAAYYNRKERARRFGRG